MKPTRPLMLVAALTLALAGAAVAGVVAHATADAKTIKVTEKEFKITVTGKPAKGADRFVVKNTGQYPHALSIAGPGIKTKRTPMIQPGKSAVLNVTLKSGSYTLWCPVPGHAAKGMKTAFKIAGAVSGGGDTSTGGGGYGTSTDSTTTGGEAWG
ncbi:MAG TPA: cupredoxin domain-containing protein [Gaiellaceae bacterium]|jgi:uncharacterized cupredoxin-like copper-binding protein|nr:cupredoxin domain-containing protein [Gaiellaceae bacterium]